MSQPFATRYSHPFTFDELRELEAPILAGEITRLGHSIERLKDSNDQIRSHVASLEAEDAEEAAEMNGAIAENEETIKAQEERILLLKHALEAKMGFDPTNSHYGVEENRAIINPASAQTPRLPVQPTTTAPPVNGANGTPDVVQENGTGEGMYL